MTEPDLVVEVLEDTRTVTVVLRGELDTHGEPAAREALERAAAVGPRVVLDLRALEFIDSAGLRLVLTWNRRLTERDVAFSIVRGAVHVQRPFTSAGLDALLPFVDGPPA